MNARATADRGAGPQRTCIGCRRTADQSRLVRLVRSSEGEVLVDHPHKLGGRGVYVCGSMACLTRALRSPRLGRLVGGPVTPPAPPALGEQISARISRRVEGLLAAAWRAQKAVVGASGVEAGLRGGRAQGLVVVARDASPRVRDDLEAAAREAGTAVMEYGDKAQLGLPFARDAVAATLVFDEGLAGAVRAELELLAGFAGSSARNEIRGTPSQRERS